MVPTPVLPEVKEVMLEQFHFPHKSHVLRLDVLHLFLEDLDFSLDGLLQVEVEDLDLERDVFDCFFADELVLLDPLLQLWDVLRLDVRLGGELIEVVRVLHGDLDVRYLLG